MQLATPSKYSGRAGGNANKEGGEREEMAEGRAPNWIANHERTPHEENSSRLESNRDTVGASSRRSLTLVARWPAHGSKGARAYM